MRFKFFEENTEVVYFFDLKFFKEDNQSPECESLETAMYEEVVDGGACDGNGTEAMYGVHDFSTDGLQETGFTSYEIGPAKMPEVMEIFRKWFEARGLGPSEVKTMEGREYFEEVARQ